MSTGVDWPKVVQVSNRQRVEGLVADGLRSVGDAVPAPIKSALDASAAENARLSLFQAAESLRLQRLFEAAGIGLTFIKGTALALLAYGNIGIKHSWDIDIVVEDANVLAAAALLRTVGYVREIPDEGLDDGRFLEWSTFAHECLWKHPSRGLCVELHWRLTQNSSHLAHVFASRRVAVLDGQFISTLGDEDLFAYLCLHGARHGWSRLKWLADLAAWLVQMPPQDVERLHRVAQSAGVGRASAQALLLCERLLEFPLAPGLADELRSDRSTRWLVAIALHSMAGDDRMRQIEERLASEAMIQFSHFLLAPNPGAWVKELQSKSIGWNEFSRVRLPRPLYFLYPLMRIPSWLWRRIARLVGRP